MNKKKIIVVRIAEGLGNQLFMFANSYFIAKVKKCILMIEGEKREVAVLCNDGRHASRFGRLFKHPR